VLVVADGMASRRALRERVKAAFPEGRVDEACTADEALSMLRRRDYSLLVADHAVGLLSGADVLEVAAREHPWTMRVLAAAREAAPPPGRAHALLPLDAPTEATANALRTLLGTRA